MHIVIVTKQPGIADPYGHSAGNGTVWDHMPYCYFCGFCETEGNCLKLNDRFKARKRTDSLFIVSKLALLKLNYYLLSVTNYKDYKYTFFLICSHFKA